jgi:metal-responsive CopG/Arc/MetJ family transcriptional regulator
LTVQKSKQRHAFMRLNVELKMDVYEEFGQHCAREGKSRSEVVRWLVTNWNAKKRREELQILRVQEAQEEVSDDEADRVG